MPQLISSQNQCFTASTPIVSYRLCSKFNVFIRKKTQHIFFFANFVKKKIVARSTLVDKGGKQLPLKLSLFRKTKTHTHTLSLFGAKTFSIMTFSIMTFSIMRFSKMRFSIMRFSIMTFSIMTFSIMTHSILANLRHIA